ncbi:hypothetical protein GCM10010915_18460 [Microbacterium faecale]|uniref:Uncharacterized protein n=1 Tax=Microbacterium faecale TaxID=1804630 RepID=A0A917DH33_9MICO|nr:hypothetical protein GCM10010915_18460 [Microbacterium faecale]
MKRHVADQHRMPQRVTQRVGVLNLDTRQVTAEPPHAVLIDVDRRDPAIERGERSRERSVARADLQDRAFRTCDEPGDACNGRCVDKKVLAEFVSAAEN